MSEHSSRTPRSTACPNSWRTRWPWRPKPPNATRSSPTRWKPTARPASPKSSAALRKEEKAHLVELNEMCSRYELPHYAPWDFKWTTGESPEAIAIDQVSYRMSVGTRRRGAGADARTACLRISTAGIAQRASDDEVRILASQFAAEEREHIGWLESCLADCGPDDGAIDDPDPPLSQE
jgi:hypothetical protein